MDSRCRLGAFLQRGDEIQMIRVLLAFNSPKVSPLPPFANGGGGGGEFLSEGSVREQIL